MKLENKVIKEANIIVAAEKIFAAFGFKNAKMEDIASEAGITKVTLYSYFQSKENLYMAISYKALDLLTIRFNKIVERGVDKNGIELCLELTACFMDFCESNYLYSEALLEYFALIRSSNKGEDLAKLPLGVESSTYFERIKQIQNEPFKIIARQIIKGQNDGSIDPELDPMLYTLMAWTSCVGYIKIVSANGDNISPLLNVNLKELRDLNLKITRDTLKN